MGKQIVALSGYEIVWQDEAGNDDLVEQIRLWCWDDEAQWLEPMFYDDELGVFVPVGEARCRVRPVGKK